VSGDEPQLLARSLPGVPVLAARRRVLAGRLACAELGVDVCVLDDAFQYWRLARDLEIVLIHAADPFGGGRIFPRGALRESLAGLRRADAAILTHVDAIDAAERAALKEAVRRRNPGIVLGEARHRPVGLRVHPTEAALPLETLRGGRFAALSSLGDPASFARTLTGLGVAGTESAAFPDHHPYTEADLRSVRDRVAAGALDGIVTTEKDAVKIPAAWLGETRCLVLEIDLDFVSGENDIERLLRERTAARRG
jgi:tetraacyldisaccharide 4'-kinase